VERSRGEGGGLQGSIHNKDKLNKGISEKGGWGGGSTKAATNNNEKSQQATKNSKKQQRQSKNNITPPHIESNESPPHPLHNSPQTKVSQCF